jgi:hypothetical protein
MKLNGTNVLYARSLPLSYLLNNHDSVDGISKPLDALEYEIQIDEIEKLIPDILKVLAEDDHG